MLLDAQLRHSCVNQIVQNHGSISRSNSLGLISERAFQKTDEATVFTFSLQNMKNQSLFIEFGEYWSAPASAPQLPVWRQLIEMSLLYFFRRIGPRYYMQGRWGRAEIPFRHKWQHINRTEYRRLIHRLNPQNYRKSSQHKLIEKAVLSLQNITTPRFIGFVHAARGRSSQGKPVQSALQLRELLLPFVDQRVCFKPVESFGGFGFASYLVTLTGDQLALIRKADEPPLRVEEWWDINGQNEDGFLLESFLQQHPDLAALHQHSLNTIRIWVVLLNGSWQVLGGFLRIGCHGSQVDNQSSGGIACPLHVDSGTIRFAIDSARPGYPVQIHPNTKHALPGFQVPFWQEAKVLAGEAVAAFPHMRLAGLDMAITPSGPCLIELNVMPDYMGCAYMDLALKDYVYDQD
jgi:hypothetical protein